MGTSVGSKLHEERIAGMGTSVGSRLHEQRSQREPTHNCPLGHAHDQACWHLAKVWCSLRKLIRSVQTKVLHLRCDITRVSALW